MSWGVRSAELATPRHAVWVVTEETTPKRTKTKKQAVRPQDRRDFKPSNRYREYTPLKASITNILYAIREDPDFCSPRRVPSGKGDPSKYCEYHKGNGHSTEECIGLKDEIERLIRTGNLGRFVQDHVQPRQQSKNEHPPYQRQDGQGGKQVIGTVETIIEWKFPAVQSIAYSDNHPKTATEQIISFGDEDLKGVIAPHQDPLVITAEIGDLSFRVKCILIDNGSSVNVLFTSSLQKMNISDERLQPAAGSIYGFNGAPVPVEGTITLPITLGEFPA